MSQNTVYFFHCFDGHNVDAATKNTSMASEDYTEPVSTKQRDLVNYERSDKDQKNVSCKLCSNRFPPQTQTHTNLVYHLRKNHLDKPSNTSLYEHFIRDCTLCSWWLKTGYFPDVRNDSQRPQGTSWVMWLCPCHYR